MSLMNPYKTGTLKPSLILTMDLNPETNAWIEKAVKEVDRDLLLPNNSLVDGTSLPLVPKVLLPLKPLEVRVNVDFMALVPDERIQHSEELKRLKCATVERQLFRTLRKLLEE